jgi:hypothetical protein
VIGKQRWHEDPSSEIGIHDSGLRIGSSRALGTLDRFGGTFDINLGVIGEREAVTLLLAAQRRSLDPDLDEDRSNLRDNAAQRRFPRPRKPVGPHSVCQEIAVDTLATGEHEYRQNKLGACRGGVNCAPAKFIIDADWSAQQIDVQPHVPHLM